MLDTTHLAAELELQDSSRDNDWTRDACYHEYSRAADPIRQGHVSAVPILVFPPSLYGASETRCIPLDISADLRCRAPATSPGLCANFVRILPDEKLDTDAVATSELFYVLRGAGYSETRAGVLHWEAGDFFTLPGGLSTHHAEADSVFYYVHDAPLLAYLGVQPVEPRFAPTLYPHERCRAELEKVRRAATADTASRVSVLLTNRANDQTLTATHVLWAMYGVLPQGKTQRAHRHQSVALDLIVEAPANCYTLLGDEVDGEGHIIDGVRVPWESGAAFITPPGLWHSHHNEGTADAYVIPIQDAGLQTHLRALDIRFGPQSN